MTRHQEVTAELVQPWADFHGDLPDYDHPLRCVYESGIQYAVELLAKELGVRDYEPCDGTEDFDGDLGGTLMNIVMAALPKDENGDPLRPSEICEQIAALAQPSPVEAEDDVARELPWLVWSNEHRAFWAENRCGYTGRIEKAGRYTKAEAEKICNGANYRANSTIYEGTPPEICMPAPEALDAALARAGQGYQAGVRELPSAKNLIDEGIRIGLEAAADECTKVADAAAGQGEQRRRARGGPVGKNPHAHRNGELQVGALRCRDAILALAPVDQGEK